MPRFMDKIPMKQIKKKKKRIHTEPNSSHTPKDIPESSTRRDFQTILQTMNNVKSNRDLIKNYRNPKSFNRMKETSTTKLQNFSFEKNTKSRKEIRKATINLIDNYDKEEGKGRMGERNAEYSKGRIKGKRNSGGDYSVREIRRKINYFKGQKSKAAKSNEDIIINRINNNLESFVTQKSQNSRESQERMEGMIRDKSCTSMLRNSKSGQMFTLTLNQAKIAKKNILKTQKRYSEVASRTCKPGRVRNIKVKSRSKSKSGRYHIKSKPYIEVIPINDLQIKNTSNFNKSGSALNKTGNLFLTENNSQFWEEGRSFLSANMPKSQSRDRFKTYNFSILNHLDKALKRNKKSLVEAKPANVNISKHLTSQRSFRPFDKGAEQKSQVCSSKSTKNRVFLKKKSEAVNNLKRKRENKSRDFWKMVRRNSKSGDLHDAKKSNGKHLGQNVNITEFNFHAEKQSKNSSKDITRVNKPKKKKKKAKSFIRTDKVFHIDNPQKKQIYCAKTQKIEQNGLKEQNMSHIRSENNKIKKCLIGKIKSKLSKKRSKEGATTEKKLQYIQRVVKNFESRLSRIPTKRQEYNLKNSTIREQTYFEKFIFVNNKAKISSLKFLNLFVRRKKAEIKKSAFELLFSRYF